MRDRHPLFLPAVAALAIAVASAAGFFFFRDNFSTHYAMKFASAEAWRAGELPYWNLYDGGGQPLAANPNALTFYPDNFLYLVLPLHVAFNLHFFLHLVAGWLAMRALAPERRTFAAWLYVLSGAAITACAFYNLVVYVALIPLAFLAIERRSTWLLALSFGLMGLAAEPMTIVGVAIACAMLSVKYLRASKYLGASEYLGVPRGDRSASASSSEVLRGTRGTPRYFVVAAVPLAFAIALPQLVATSEIAREVERARGFSARTILNASLSPARLLEVLIGPWSATNEPRLFLSLMIGVIAIPALLQRSRYTAVAWTMLFFALGRFNPIAAALIPQLRVARFPEKLALPFVAAVCVLAARFLTRQRKHARLWMIVTFVPLIGWAIATLPLDFFDAYHAPPAFGRRFVPSAPGGQTLDRADYRRRAARGEPLFGATAGTEYVLNRSGDGMHSLFSRIAAERWDATHNRAWLRIAAGPRVSVVPRAVAVGNVDEAVLRIERGERGIAPPSFADFTSPADVRVANYVQSASELSFDVSTPAPALLLVNQTYFTAWQATTRDGTQLRTLPLDLDRLGVVVPAGTHKVVLRFGRHRTLVAAAWVVSSLLLVLAIAASAWSGPRLARPAGKMPAVHAALGE